MTTFVRRAAVINDVGTVEWSDSGPGTWLCTRSGAGTYVLTFPQPFVGGTADFLVMACANVSLAQALPIYARYTAITLAGLTIVTFSPSGNIDQRFTIEILGNVA